MTMNSLRENIISEMRRYEADQAAKFPGQVSSREFCGRYCTWWFSRRAGIPTKDARRELLKMEREGLVNADRSQSNNTRWLLVAAPTSGEGETK